MDKINLTVDGKKIEVPAGTTVMSAAKMLGIKIPRLCYHENLPLISACRLCLVEVEGAKTLIASCSYPVSEGMVVRTDSERVIQARKMVLELLLSTHPLDCLTCEKSGDCKLEKYAYELKVSSSRFTGEKNTYSIENGNPFIERDMNKCILCGRCIFACGEVQYQEIYDYAYRGFKTKVSTAFEKSLLEAGCVFCGQCVRVCPVGAIIEKSKKSKGREWEFSKVKTTCPYCGCGCEIELNIKEGEIIRVTSDPQSAVNRGNLCVKGKFGFEFIQSKERLTTPLIRLTVNASPPARQGERLTDFKETPWEKALKLVADKLLEVKNKYGPEAIAGLASAKCTNEENYLFQKFMRAVIGTNNVDHCARLCHAPSVTGLAKAFGSGAMTNTIAELRNADCILITGSNTSETHPIIALEIKAAVRQNNAKLIVADPRKIEMTNFATLWLRHKPGTDVALFNGIVNVIINKKLYNEKFINEHTEGFNELKETVKKYTPEYVEKITGVPAEDIVLAAQMYAEAKNGSIVYSMGITQHTTGTDNVVALANLALLTGHVGRESTGVNPLRGQNNVQGACDMGALPNFLPGYQKLDNQEVREKIEKLWGAKLPSNSGLTVVEMFDAILKGKIKAMYIMGENVMLSDPNIHHVEEALKKLEFLVVQEMFLSETAKFADVVLPSCSFAEKDGTFTNTERRMQRVRKAIEPIGESKPDWQIIVELAQRMGYPMPNYQGPAEIMDEIASLTPIYGGIDYSRLDTQGLFWPCPDKMHPGTKILHQNKFSRGLGKFHRLEYKPPAEETDEDYPLILTTGRILYHYHTGTMTRRVDGLNQIVPTGYVELNPSEGKKYGLKDGELANVSSRRGSILTKVSLTERVAPGVVFIPFHFAETAANILTNDALDPEAKMPELKVCAVRLDPAGSEL
jgi:formate dehydrogenase alpha subunit